MEGVSRASGKAYIVVRIPKSWKSADNPNDGSEGFDEYKWPPLRVEEFAVVENHLLKNRLSPIDAVLPEIEKLLAANTKASRRMAKRLEAAAYADLRKSKAQNKLSIEEVQAWLDTPEGILFTMKVCLQRFHPDITDADVRRIFEWEGENEAKRLRDFVQGVDALGNSTGPNLADGARAEPVAGSTGESSTDTSPKNTDGIPTPSAG